MLKYWKRFWRARRQKDSVKMALLLAAAAIGFLAGAAYRGVALYRMVNRPTEYVLSGGSASDLVDMPYLVAVGVQRESQRALVRQGREFPVSCIALSEEYLRKAYGIEVRGATETFYANQPALRQMEVTEREVFATCAPEKRDKYANNESEFQSTVKITLAEGIHDQENPLIFVVDAQQGAAADGMGLQQASGSGGIGLQQGAASGGADSRLRVCFQRQDLEGSQRKQIEQRGFTVENREQLLEGDYRKEGLLQQMKYEALIGLLLSCFFFVSREKK